MHTIKEERFKLMRENYIDSKGQNMTIPETRGKRGKADNKEILTSSERIE